MPSWKSLLAACCCLVLAASTASAALLYRGLTHTATGSATVEQSPTGRLSITNIGSSGQDGVSISTAGLDGVRLPMSGSLYQVSDVGSSISLTYHWRLVGLPTSSMSLSLVVQPSSLTFSPVMVSSISSSVRVRCSSGGAIVLDSSIPFGSSVSMEMPPGATCPLPAMSCALDRVALELRCSAEWSSSRVLFVGGQSVSCDAVMFSVVDNDCDDEDCDGLDSELRVTSPPGSSLSSLECVRTDFVSHGRFMSGEGQVVVSPQVVTSHRRLPVTNIGSSGQDGVSLYRSPGSGGGGGGALCSPSTCGLSGACMLHLAPPSLSFDPRVDEGKGCVTRVYGTSSSSPTETLLGSVHITITGGNFRATPNFTGMAAQAESCVVLDNGVEVYRTAVSSGSSVQIDAPTGQPLGMAINEKGLPGEKKIKKKTAAPQAGPGRAQPIAAEFVSEQDILPIEVGFVGDRVIVFGGNTRVTGDEIVFWGERAPTGAGSSLSISSQQCLMRCASSSSSTSMELVGASSSSGDLVSCDAPSSSHLSSSSTCVEVPVVIDRIDSTPMRAYSVTFHLSPELVSCVTGVTESDYLSRTASTQMFVVDNGGGSFTVDCSVLGGVCGSTGDGELFRLHLSASAPVASALGSVVIDAVQLRDCSNLDVPGAPGGSAFLPIDFAAPSPVSSFTVTQVSSGNDVSGTTKLHVSHAPLDADAGLAVFTKTFGGYPEYDDDPTAGAPSPPSSEDDAISQGWTLVDVSRDGLQDVVVGARGFHYFVVTARDAYGNPSSMSSRTDGTLNYHLGDVSNGLATCAGNNRVGPEDISLLGAHYGSSLSYGSSFACLDVGPTSDHSTHGRPMTDNKLGFEDLVVFAMNYLTVSGPGLAAVPAAAAANVASLEVPELPAVGGTFDAVVRIEGSGDIQALSLKLDFDPAVIEQVSVAPGELLDAQGRESAVLSPGPGQIDAALLGGGTGLSGSGALARVTFRVKSGGDAGLALAGITARDGENQPVAMSAVTGADPGAARTGLAMAFPNPFDDATALRFGLASPGRVSLVVFDIAGRRVRKLLDGTLPSGERIVSWDGRDDAGLRLAPGAYVVRFEAGGQRESRVVRLLR
jgi:hypothetical protein